MRFLIMSFTLLMAGCVAVQAQTPVINSVTDTSRPGAPPGMPVAPGELVAIQGTGLAVSGVFCGNGTTGIPAVCNGTSVTVGGKAAAVRNVGPGNAVIQIPVDIPLGTAAVVVSKVSGANTLTSAPFNVTVQATMPNLFIANNSTIAFCFTVSGNVQITAANPAVPGDAVKCIGSGFGATNPAVTTGAPVPQTPLPAVVAPVKITVGGVNATVTSATWRDGNANSVGQNQVIFTVPVVAGPNAVVVASVGGVDSNGVPLPVAPVGAYVTGVVNSASNAVDGMPNAGVAPGSILVAYGRNMGPSSISVAPGYPWPKTLSGTSAKVTVGTTTVDLLLYYTLDGQIAGLLPSNTPAGTGTISVTYNGQTGSTPSPIKVSANNFGVYTVPQNGQGAGIVTYPDYSLVTTDKAANAGETLIIWGTGLGAVSGNEAAGPLPGDMTNLPVQVWVGGVSSTVAYRGRSGCCVGEDQIAFVVPANVTGCLVPLVVQIGSQVSNTSTMAIAATGRKCTPTVSLVPPAFTSIQQPKVIATEIVRNLRPPPVVAGDAVSEDSIDVRAVKITGPGTAINVAADVPSMGSCLVTPGDLPEFQADLLQVLDLGANLTLRGPAGTRTIPKTGFIYATTLGDTTAGNFLDAGAYTLTSPGSVEVPAFSAAFTMPAFTWTNRPSGNAQLSVPKAQGVRVTWTGGDPNGVVEVSGGSGYATDKLVVFSCTAKVSDGGFTIPPSVLLGLPAGNGFLAVKSLGEQTFAATGVDLGVVLLETGATAGASFQ